jgi:protein-disulfide isomerase
VRRFRLLLDEELLSALSTCGTLGKIPYDFEADLEVFVKRRLLLVATVGLLVASLGLGALLLVAAPFPQKLAGGKNATPAKAAAAATPAQTQITVNGVVDIDPTKAFGNKSAPVVIEVYSDFQCPACKQLFTTTTQRVNDNYVNTGKVYMVHRDYPLPMHAYSRVAASYARAAAHIGKCEPVEVALFQNQEKWEASGDVKGIVASVLNPADMKKVQSLVDGKTLEPLIERDKQLGMAVPVNQTPTSIIHAKNGQSYPVIGFVSYDVLKTLLDQLVAQGASGK